MFKTTKQMIKDGELDEFCVVAQQKEQYLDSYIQNSDKELTILTRLKNVDLLYTYPETKRKSLQKQLNRIKENKEWLNERINELNKKELELLP
jgi:hypothetical protein